MRVSPLSQGGVVSLTEVSTAREVRSREPTVQEPRMPVTAVHAEPISGDINPDLAIISSLGEHLRGQYVLVRVRDDAGRVGLGEASVTSVWSGETQAGTIALLNEVLG